MLRRTLILIACSAVALPPLASGAQGDRVPLPLAAYGEQIAHRYPTVAPPDISDPQQRISWLVDEHGAQGRTPAEWVRWVTDALQMDGHARALPARDLTREVERIYAAVGAPVTPAVHATIAARANRMPPALREAFGGVVGVVADVTVRQAALTAAIAPRVRPNSDPATWMTHLERDAMAAGQRRIAEAVDAFATMIARLPMPAAAPIFADPEGLIVLGGQDDDEYTRSGSFPDPVLLIDPSGNDVYRTSAGGACPIDIDLAFGGQWMDCNDLPVSVNVDLDGDDAYDFSGAPSAVQGAGGPGGHGLLIDVTGNDTYRAHYVRGATGPWQPFVQYFDGGAQGFSYAGVGALIDAQGDDVYHLDLESAQGWGHWGFAQGFGGAGGLGIQLDGGGDDFYESDATGPLQNSRGFQGLYTNGTGFYGGVGIQVDAGLGNDRYDSRVIAQTVDYYAFAFGAFGGVGILYEDGGDDWYYTYEEGSNPFINPLLNCAFGTASFGGIGIMLELGGDDVYYGGTRSSKAASVMNFGFSGPGAGYSAFADLGGADEYVMDAIGTSGSYETGWGLLAPEHGFLEGANTFATFLDVGGVDVYEPPIVGNDAQWPFGADVAS